jgi:hypothetical protein
MTDGDAVDRPQYAIVITRLSIGVRGRFCHATSS